MEIAAQGQRHHKEVCQRRHINHSKANARGGPHRALILDRCIFFSMDKLSNMKPIPEEDREEYALGVILVPYSMNAGIKKFKD